MQSLSLNAVKIKGFTLIEVAVALAILGWVLGSAIFLVHQYANERLKMRDNFLINQVAWNQLMEEYRHVQEWSLATDLDPARTGTVENGSQQWQWRTDVQAALGQDLFKYQISVALNGEAGGRQTEIPDEAFTPSLSLYLISPGAKP